MRGTHPFCADLRPSHPAASSAPHAAPARLDADRKPPHSLCRQKLSTSTKSLPDASAWEAWAIRRLESTRRRRVSLGVLLARAWRPTRSRDPHCGFGLSEILKGLCGWRHRALQVTLLGDARASVPMPRVPSAPTGECNGAQDICCSTAAAFWPILGRLLSAIQED